MNRRSLLGRFAALPSANRAAERPDYFHTVLEPLETRMLLSAAPLNWTIDQSVSNATLSIQDATLTIDLAGNRPVQIRIRNQNSSGSGGTWTDKRSASISGTLATNFVDGSSVQFMTGLSNISEIDSGSYRPNPGTGTVNPDYNPALSPPVGTSAYPTLYSNFSFDPNQDNSEGTFISNGNGPAAFAGRANVHLTYPLTIIAGVWTVQTPVTADVAYLSLGQIKNDFDSTPLAISGGSFAANTTNLGLSQGFASVQSIKLLDLSPIFSGFALIPSLVTLASGLISGTNAAPTGTISVTGTLTRQLTLPLNIPFTTQLDTNLTSTALSGGITGSIVANVTLIAPVVDLNGDTAGTGFSNIWSTGTGPVNVAGSAASTPNDAKIFSDVQNLAATNSVKVSLAAAAAGDVLAANTSGTSISATFAGGVLTLSGSDSVTNYEQVLRTVTYNNTSGGPGVSSVTINTVATDSVNLASSAVTSTISILAAPVVDLSTPGGSTGNTSAWNNTGAVNITTVDAAITDTDSANLSLVTASIASPSGGDVLAATGGGGVTVTGGGTASLTLSGAASKAAYSAVLETITFNSTTLTNRTVTINVQATDDTSLAGNTAVGLVNVATNNPPAVDLSVPGGTINNTAIWTGSAVKIADATSTVTDADGGNLASIKVVLNSPHTGDVLDANVTGTGITKSFVSNTLTLSGSQVIANYQTVLRSVTYNNTSGGPTVNTETINVVANDGTADSAVAVATINMPPVILLTIGAGSGTPNYATTWYNNGGAGGVGAVPIENMAQASVTDPAGLTTISSMTVSMSSFHTGDVLAVPILSGIPITTTYSAGVLTLTGSTSLVNYQKELRLINYNNTSGGPGTSPVTAVFTASDGTLSSNPVTATISVALASGNILGNRLFYNNSKYDGNNAVIAASDDLAIAPDKVGFNGVGTAGFANVSSYFRGITGVMIDVASGIGTHSAINLTSGDITFKVAPAAFVAGTYNQLSTWAAAPTPTAISVRLGAGVGGSDRIEITWASNAIKNTWLEVNLNSVGNSGLGANDVFYFGNMQGDTGLSNLANLARTDASDYTLINNNFLLLTTPVWNILDVTKSGNVDATDLTIAQNNFGITLRFIANPTGPFAPDAGPSASPSASPAAAPAAAPAASSSAAVASGLTSVLSHVPAALPSWLSGSLHAISDNQGVAKILQNLTHQNSTQIHHTIDQIAEKFHLNDDVLDGLLADLGLPH